MRTDITPQVDPMLIKLFHSILMDKLQKPEEWKGENGCYRSTYINPATRTYFTTKGIRGSDLITDFVEIRNGEYSSDILCEMPIDRKGRRLIRKLNSYMNLKSEWEKYEEIDKKLKKALPENIDRFLKITKIKDKL